MGVFAEHLAGRIGEVDMLEDAVGAPKCPPRDKSAGRKTIGGEGYDLARLDVANIGGVDDVQGAGLAGHHPGLLQPSQAQRPVAGRVAHRLDPVGIEQQQTI